MRRRIEEIYVYVQVPHLILSSFYRHNTYIACVFGTNDQTRKRKPTNACMPLRTVHPKKKKRIDFEGMKFHSMEQTVSTVVTMARVAVTVAGFVIVIFEGGWLVRG